jgi:tricarballylate dehydrogenase
MTDYDVVIAGGGNAALCAAIEAAELGARVIILEAAPKHMRGGNSRHTRNFRCMHSGPLSVLSDSYDEDEYFDDLLLVTGGATDPELARLAIRESEACLPWMESQGVIFQPSLSGTLSLGRTNAFFLGGGKALVNAYYARAEDLGVAIRYDTPVTHVHIEDGRFRWLELADGSRVTGRAAVLASGGFQADLD